MRPRRCCAGEAQWRVVLKYNGYSLYPRRLNDVTSNSPRVDNPVIQADSSIVVMTEAPFGRLFIAGALKFFCHHLVEITEGPEYEFGRAFFLRGDAPRT
jgi:hypothetical protein